MRGAPRLSWVAGVALALCLSGCAWSTDPGLGLGGPNTLDVFSTGFSDEGPIPSEYTCDGANAAPPFRVENVPPGTASLFIWMDDPDADGFLHWLAWNLPGRSGNVSAGENLTALGASLGLNDFGLLGYGGPCPPPGSQHRYRLRVFALDQVLDVEAGAGVAEVVVAAQAHVVGWGQLAGTYQRV